MLKREVTCCVHLGGGITWEDDAQPDRPDPECFRTTRSSKIVNYTAAHAYEGSLQVLNTCYGYVPGGRTISAVLPNTSCENNYNEDRTFDTGQATGFAG